MAPIDTTPTPTAEAADPEHTQVLEVLSSYVRAANLAATEPDPLLAELRKYAMSSVYQPHGAAIRSNLDAGRVYTGGIEVVAAEVTFFDPDASFPDPGAVVSVCVDISNYTLVDLGTGEPVPVDRDLEMYMTTFSLVLGSDERWLVYHIESHPEEPC